MIPMTKFPPYYHNHIQNFHNLIYNAYGETVSQDNGKNQ